MIYLSHFSTLRKVSLFVLLLLITGACTTTEQVSEQESSPRQERDLSDLEEQYWANINNSRMNFTEADVEFMLKMIPHHSQALIMSRLAPENGASRSVQTLAARIINAQKDEIELMQRWLADRDQPVPEIHIDGLNMMIHGLEDGGGHGHHSMDDHADMPGMLSQGQLEELAAATGTKFDRKFLEFMIEHHRGAVIMVETLFAADSAAADREMFDLASGINADQVTEIERMEQMLANIR